MQVKMSANFGLMPMYLAVLLMGSMLSPQEARGVGDCKNTRGANPRITLHYNVNKNVGGLQGSEYKLRGDGLITHGLVGPFDPWKRRGFGQGSELKFHNEFRYRSIDHGKTYKGRNLRKNIQRSYKVSWGKGCTNYLEFTGYTTNGFEEMPAVPRRKVMCKVSKHETIWSATITVSNDGYKLLTCIFRNIKNNSNRTVTSKQPATLTDSSVKIISGSKYREGRKDSSSSSSGRRRR